MRTIYLHQIDEEDSVSYMTSHIVFRELDRLNGAGKADITLKMVSVDGGDVGHGMAIYSAVKNSRAKVNIECYGLTASCGTIILQAGNWRGVCADGFFMVHFGSTSLDTDLVTAESYINSSKIWRAKILDIYAHRCVNGRFFISRGYSLSKVKNYINTKLRNNGDWWINDPQEIVDYGFADYIIGE